MGISAIKWPYSIVIRLKKINKCFSGHFFEKQMRQAGFYFYFPKTDEATFFFLFDQNTMRHLFFWFILSIKMLIF